MRGGRFASSSGSCLNGYEIWVNSFCFPASWMKLTARIPLIFILPRLGNHEGFGSSQVLCDLQSVRDLEMHDRTFVGVSSESTTFSFSLYAQIPDPVFFFMWPVCVLTRP